MAVVQVLIGGRCVWGFLHSVVYLCHMQQTLLALISFVFLCVQAKACSRHHCPQAELCFLVHGDGSEETAIKKRSKVTSSRVDLGLGLFSPVSFGVLTKWVCYNTQTTILYSMSQYIVKCSMPKIPGCPPAYGRILQCANQHAFWEMTETAMADVNGEYPNCMHTAWQQCILF